MFAVNEATLIGAAQRGEIETKIRSVGVPTWFLGVLWKAGRRVDHRVQARPGVGIELLQ